MSGNTQANTSLDQISDWLTKIIIGVSLVQIGRVPPAVGKLADILQKPLGNLPASGTFGAALAIFCALLGFFNLYLWSRALLADEWKLDNAAADGADDSADGKGSSAGAKGGAAGTAGGAKGSTNQG